MDATRQLFESIREHDLEGVKFALAGGADVHALSESGQGVLHSVIVPDSESKKADTKLIDMLLAAGADINQRNGRGQTPLDAAMNAPLSIYSGYTVITNASLYTRAFYERNAKATDHEKNICNIRLAALGLQSSGSYLDEIGAALSARLREKGRDIAIPSLDAPATANNQDDPFLAYGKAFRFSKDVVTGLLRPKNRDAGLVELMSNINTSWEKYAAAIPDDARRGLEVFDMLIGVTSRLIAPVVLRDVSDKKLMGDDFHNVAIVNRIGSDFWDTVAKGRTALQVFELAESYKQNMPALLEQSIPDVDHLIWTPLIKGGKTLHPVVPGGEGYTIEQITSMRDIIDEAKRGNESFLIQQESLLKGEFHAFAIRDAEGKTVRSFGLKPKNELNKHLPTVRTAENEDFVLWPLGYTSEAEVSGAIVNWLGRQLKRGNLKVADRAKRGACGEAKQWKRAYRLEQELGILKEEATTVRIQQVFDRLAGNDGSIAPIVDSQGRGLMPDEYRNRPVEEFVDAFLREDMAVAYGEDYTPPPQAKGEWAKRVSGERGYGQAAGI